MSFGAEYTIKDLGRGGFVLAKKENNANERGTLQIPNEHNTQPILGDKRV